MIANPTIQHDLHHSSHRRSIWIAPAATAAAHFELICFARDMASLTHLMALSPISFTTWRVGGWYIFRKLPFFCVNVEADVELVATESDFFLISRMPLPGYLALTCAPPYSPGTSPYSSASQSMAFPSGTLGRNIRRKIPGHTSSSLMPVFCSNTLL